MPEKPRDCFMKKLTVIVLLLALFSCNDKNREHPDPVEFSWDFAAGTERWTGDFAGYPMEEEELYMLVFEHDTLPKPLNQNQFSLKMSGNNLGGDLFMFAKIKVTGLKPNTVYYTTFTVEFASDVPDGIVVAGRLAGESVQLKAGATVGEPVKTLDSENFYRPNIDKGNPKEDGDDMVVIGNFANGTNQAVYTLKTVSNEKPFHITTGDNGELWVIIGTDSVLEDSATIYYNKVKVEFF